MTNNPYQAPSADLTRDDEQNQLYDYSSRLSTKGREGRSNFIAFSTLYTAIFLLAALVVSQLGNVGWLIGILGGVLFISIMIRLQIRRLHDLNLTGWLVVIPFVLNYLSNYGGGLHSGSINDMGLDGATLAVFLAISAYFAALGFIRGNPEKNQYADPPRPPATWAKVVAVIMSALMLLFVALSIIGFFIQT